MTKVVVQKWEESERGWGVRPDGYSIHLTDADRHAYINKYWDSMPKSFVPDEYSRPSGTPYVAEVNLDKGWLKMIQTVGGIRIYNNKYPGDGGKDGWVNVK